MKRQIRQNVFETNSSSTHAICITKNDILDDKEEKQHIIFHIGNFGWELREFYDVHTKAEYLYTAILYNDRFDLLKKLQNILDKYEISYTFMAPVFAKDSAGGRYLFNGRIDHGYNLKHFIEEVCNDEGKLLRYLFSSESFILTGNDNSYVVWNIKVDSNEYDTYGKGC